MISIVRFFLVLLCLALTHTASASAPGGMDCHGAGDTSTLEAVAPSHDAHTTTHLQHQVSVEHTRTHADCDCAMKCGCLQHCANSGLMAQSSWAVLSPALPAFTATALATNLPLARISSLFRPPIATLS